METLKISISQNISLEHFEEIIVTALEGGSNYWYSLSPNDFEDNLEGKKEEPLSSRIAKTLYNDPKFQMKVYDVEEDNFELGIVSQESMLKAIEIAYEKYNWVYEDLIQGNGDADTADALFQLATLGELVYG